MCVAKGESQPFRGRRPAGGAGGLEIGDDCIIGPYFSCHPENHLFPETDRLIRLQGTERKGIHIGINGLATGLRNSG